jgi:23S rRNA pseudouridine2605 synthase
MRSKPARRPARKQRAPASAAGAAPPGAPERVQKVLAREGIASRRQAEDWIRAGRLTINGAMATLGARVARNDKVRLDGRLVHARPATAAGQVLLLHRSPGEPLSAAEGAGSVATPTGRPALLERLPRRSGRRFIAISPMPRIDGGLELVTSDGALAQRLQRGVHMLTSIYSVRVLGELSETQRLQIGQGLLDSGARLTVERVDVGGGEGLNRWYTVAARGASGKQIRQLLERAGARVGRVLRTQLGPLALERSLARGRFRELTAEEREALLSTEVADATQT